MEDVILVLESKQPDVLGDLSLYRNEQDAERALEVVDVNNNEFFAYTLDGRRLDLRTDGDRVRISVSADPANYAGTVRTLLEGNARAVARNKVGLQNIPGLSLEELVALNGFSV